MNIVSQESLEFADAVMPEAHMASCPCCQSFARVLDELVEKQGAVRVEWAARAKFWRRMAILMWWLAGGAFLMIGLT